MIVYDIRCDSGHGFEGWFADSEAFIEQRDSGLIPCPYCGSKSVERALSVPRIGGKRGSNEPSKDTLRRLTELQSSLLKDSKWVGDDFARRARAMADGAEPLGTIHGQTTLDEAKAMYEDGITILPLPFRVVPPEQQN